jgi:type VI protein secretion system component VasK
MLIFAFLVLLLIAAAVVAIGLRGDHVPVEMDLYGYQIQTNSFEILLAGLIAGFVAGLMLGLARAGMRRRRARRIERREMARQAAERDRLAAERDRLAEEKAELEHHLDHDAARDETREEPGGRHSHGEQPTTPA